MQKSEIPNSIHWDIDEEKAIYKANLEARKTPKVIKLYSLSIYLGQLIKKPMQGKGKNRDLERNREDGESCMSDRELIMYQLRI